jgi:hypothetical protein
METFYPVAVFSVFVAMPLATKLRLSPWEKFRSHLELLTFHQE